MRTQLVVAIWKTRNGVISQKQKEVKKTKNNHEVTILDHQPVVVPLPGIGQAWISQLSPQPAPTVQQHSCLVVLRDKTLSQKLASFKL